MRLGDCKAPGAVMDGFGMARRVGHFPALGLSVTALYGYSTLEECTVGITRKYVKSLP